MATDTHRPLPAPATTRKAVQRCVSCSCELFDKKPSYSASNAPLCATCTENSTETNTETTAPGDDEDSTFYAAASLFSQVMISENNENGATQGQPPQQQQQQGNKGLVKTAKGPSSSSSSPPPEKRSTQEEREQLDFFVSVVEHACLCQVEEDDDHQCPTRGCSEMKSHLLHASACTSRIKGGCLVCQRVWLLLKIHAQRCELGDKCRISFCAPIQRKLEELERRKQDPRNQQQQKQDGAQRWQIRMKLVSHATQCGKSDCSFPGCAHTKKCLLRRRIRPGMTAGQGGCRTCQDIWATLQNSSYN